MKTEIYNLPVDLASCNSVIYFKISANEFQEIKLTGSRKLYGRSLFFTLLAKLESLCLGLIQSLPTRTDQDL
jgi:hypothetical protein